MINTSKMSKEAFADERKAAKLKVTFNGNQTVDGQDILSARLQEDLADKNLTIGAAFSQSFEMTFRRSQDIPLTGAYLIPEAGFDGSEWAKLGKFYVSDVSTDDNYKTVTIQASDKMALLTDAYTPSITLPATPKEVLEDIALQYNFEIDEGVTYAEVSISQLYEGSVRDYIGWLAGLSGANARFNRDGKLTFTWYRQIIAVYGDVNMDDVIDQSDITYIDENLLGSASAEEYEAILGRMIVGKAYIGAELKDGQRALLADVNQDGIIDGKDTKEIEAYLSGSPYDPTLVGTVREYAQPLTEDEIERKGLSASGNYTITALLSGTEETPLESGTGKAISFYNPYMTQAALDAIVAKNLPFSYLAAKVTYRGNPAWEVGDILHMQENNVPIMSQTMEFGEKFSATIKSLGLSDEEESAARVVPNVREVERQLPAIKQMVTDINESLLSGDAGYMELILESIDGMQRLSGFRLMDTPTLSDHTKGWLANKNGIGWSQDGFKTISKLGLDMANGKIYADQIAAGAIITNSFQIGDAMSFNGATGEITFGSNVKMSWASIEDQPDIPTNLSDLNNDEGFINSTAATEITNNAISTATIRADQITGSAFNLQNGTFFVESDSKEETIIKVSYETYEADIRAYGARFTDGTTSTAIDYDGVVTPELTTQSIWCNGNILVSGGSLQASSILYGGNELSSMFALATHDHAYQTISPYKIDCSGTVLGSKIAATSPGSTSNAAGILYSSTYGGYTFCQLSGSSRRFKHSIHELTEEKKAEFEKLYEISVKQWKYNDDYIDPADELYQQETFGIIAEDLQAAIPSAVTHDKDGIVQNYRDRDLLNAMLYLLQEQKKEIDRLKEKVERTVVT